jgi:LPS-assembly protein
MAFVYPIALRTIAILVALTLAIIAPGTTLAQGLTPGKFAPASGAENQPALIKADEITYDESLSLVTARGHVEISQGNRVLLADVVTYNQKTTVMTASGNVSLMEPTGEVYFSNYAEFTNQMRDGVLATLRVLLTDNSRMAATGGKRTNGTTTEMRKGIFSPCDLCASDPSKPPLWQIKAFRIVHDGDAKEIEYRDAIMEFDGIPVFYTPYLSTPDPTVKRRSGFLFPSFGHQTSLGAVTKVPYFWAIDSDRDATITPILTSDQGPVLAAQYRQRFMNGAMSFEGSVTDGDSSGTNVPSGQKTTRGHILGNGRFDVDETWRTGFNVARVTDSTYLPRYGFSAGGGSLNGPVGSVSGINGSKELTTSAFVEGFNERNYARLSGYSFQDLNAGAVSGKTPFVMPLGQYNYVGTADRWGGRTSIDTSILGLTRDIGTDTRRVSVRPSWQTPFTSSGGSVTTFTTALQADAYDVNNVSQPNGQNFGGQTGRLVPQAMADWRYPLAKQHEHFTEILEPVAAVVTAPVGGNSPKIPNEDSQSVDFDDLNILSMSRYPGVDRVEGGEHIVYGLRWGGYGQSGASTSTFLGQSYSFQKHPDFGTASGLENNTSDIVGRLRITPADYFDFLYRFRTDADDLMFRRNEIGVAMGPPRFRITNDYSFLRASPNPTNAQLVTVNREQMATTAAILLNDHWNIAGTTVNDLTSATGGPLYNSLSFTYHDECVTFTTTFFRRYTSAGVSSTNTVGPASGVFFNFIFKYLGEYETGQKPS